MTVHNSSQMSQHDASSSNMVRRDLAQGPILAEIKDGLLQARGIRYATAGRFEAPRQPEPWTEPIDCTKPGNICPQLPSRLSVVIGDVLTDRTQNEDCLFLSVTAPATPSASISSLPSSTSPTLSSPSSVSSTKLPVMVWIHGGAYMSGGGDLEPYDATALAQRGIVVVRINYRLGIFGMQAIPGITPGNLGLQDQIMALRWINENISYLGGDPDNVTLFGQSAGADSCFCLLVADGTEHLFRRAILQSCPWTSWTDRAILNQTLPLETQRALNGKSSTIDTKGLLAIQAQLARKATGLPNGWLAFAPYLGVYPMPQRDELASRLEHVARSKSIITGWTSDDALPFVNGRPAANRLASIPILGPLLLRLITYFATRKHFANGARMLQGIWRRQQGHCTTYSFDYFPDGNPWRAAHCIDIAFILGRWTYWADTPVLQGIHEVEYDRLGDRMKDLWAAFARGAPLKCGHQSLTENFTGVL